MQGTVNRPTLEEIMTVSREWGLNPTSKRAEGFALLERGDGDAARLVAYRLLKWTPEQWQGVRRSWNELHRKRATAAMTKV